MRMQTSASPHATSQQVTASGGVPKITIQLFKVTSMRLTRSGYRHEGTFDDPYSCMRRHGSTNPKHIARDKYRDEHAPGLISLHQQRVLSTQRRIIIINAGVVSPYTDPMSASTRLMRQSMSHLWRSIRCYQLIGQVRAAPAPHG